MGGASKAGSLASLAEKQQRHQQNKTKTNQTKDHVPNKVEVEISTRD